MKHEFLRALTGKLVIPPCSAVIVAAGGSTRMGGVDKILTPLSGTPMIVRTVSAFQQNPSIQEIVVVVRKDQKEAVTNLLAGMNKVTAVILGGDTRPESVEKGLAWCSKKARLIAIHDGARPLVSQRILNETVAMAAKTGAAVPAVPIKDTVRVIENGVGVETPNRETLYAMQTPQIFDADLIRAATKNAIEKKAAVTDDCSAVELMGMKVTITRGEEENLKVTTRLDLAVANALSRRRDSNENRPGV